jgi:hypothetical protein
LKTNFETEPYGDYAVQYQQDVQSAEIWRAAQHRRTEDLAKWLGHFLKRSEKVPDADIQRPLKPRLALTRGMRIAVVTFAAITSVSAVVEAKKPPHVVLRPTGPMPAVNVP